MKGKVSMYKVRAKEYEKKNWKVIKVFDTFEAAKKYAIQAEKKARTTDHSFDNFDVLNTITKERYIIG